MAQTDSDGNHEGQAQNNSGNPPPIQVDDPDENDKAVTTQVADPDTKCPKCNKKCQKGLQCNLCDNWFHYRCQSVGSKLTTAFESREDHSNFS